MKKRVTQKIYLACAVLFIFLSAFLQPDKWITELHQLLEAYNQKMPEEKVYLHVDKTLFKPGEDIWFAAYVTSGPNYKPTQVSGTLRVELINPKGNTVSDLMLRIVNGKAGGSFIIDNEMAGGIYRIRAWTQWQKNWDNDRFFEKEITVQKIVFPRLLMKIDFQKEAYGPGDTVKAILDIRNLKNEPAKNCPVSYTSFLKGEKVLKSDGYTDDEGKLNIIFTLPALLDSNDGILNAIITYEGSPESISRSVPIVLNKIDLQFFPEGGDMLAGQNCRIAFKALNELGKPADISGIIVDESMNEVASFDSYHQGMGAVWFTPLPGHNYFAHIIRPTGKDTVYALPEALTDGYMLNITGNNEKGLSAAISSAKESTAKLIVQVRGKIYHSRVMQVNAGKNDVSIPLEAFPAGIAQVTLFDENGAPRCERLVFVNPHKKLNIQISADKEKYAPREKVKLKVTATDENHMPVPANLSVAVVNDQVLTHADDKQDDILSSLWLSSEVTGKIYEPSFYFHKDEPKREQALDFLLMTQGWRRFKWEQVTGRDYTVSYLPDKQPVLAGQVVDRITGKGVKARLGIIAKKPSVSADEMITDDQGNFIICSLDPAATVTLYAYAHRIRRNDVIIKIDNELTTFSTSYSRPSVSAKTKDAIPGIISQKAEIRGTETLNDGNDEDQNDNSRAGVQASAMILEEDFNALEEVVVISYGTQSKNLLTASIASVETKSTIPGIRIEQSLQGKVAGIVVTQETQQMDGGSIMQIRGHNSLLNPDPLFVIDGVPILENTSNLLTPLSYLSPNDIDHLEIIKTPGAALSYGSSGGNGIVMVESKNGSSGRYYYSYGKSYSQITVYPKTNYDFCKEFYAPSYKAREAVLQRSDFRTTVFWNNEVQTDAEGIATIEFNTSDEITTFKVVAEGISANGLIGRQELNYFTQIPVYLSLKVPAYCTDVDTVLADVLLKNNTDEAINGSFDILLPENISLLEPFDPEITIPAQSAKSLSIKLKPVLTKTKISTVTFNFRSDRFSDAVTGKIEVLPYGFPVESSFSSLNKDETFIFDVGEPVNGTLSATFQAYPSILSDLRAGMESVFREPHGCFEQVSATTYPSILTLKFLYKTGMIDKATERNALGYLKEGYKILEGYETSQGGFEWYGNTPPHEGLTAFGLLEFIEMKEVYPEVSDAMIERTKKWLLTRKKGDGTFRLSSGKYGFSGASQEVSNAYILYALAEAGISISEIETEYKLALQECIASMDSYRLALIANTAYSLGKYDQAEMLMGYLRQQLAEKGPGMLTTDHTLVRSWGASAQIETASLIFLAELKAERPDYNLCYKLFSYLVKNRENGGFGNSQATTLALKALTAYAGSRIAAQGNFRINIAIQNKLVESRSFAGGLSGKIVIPNLEDYMSNGNNTFRILFDSLNYIIPYSVDLQWYTFTPVSHPRCPLDLTVDLDSKKAKLGETVRLTATLINKNHYGLPMTVVLIGIPGGLTPQPWQLKELMEKQEFAYYEIFQNYLVLYYRELGPQETRTVNFDLKTEVRGTYTAPACSAYLYYTDEFKKWIAGSKITIE